jgi:hypothetical protein
MPKGYWNTPERQRELRRLEREKKRRERERQLRLHPPPSPKPLTELHRMAIARRRRKWGGWRYSPLTSTLTFKRAHRFFYQVDLKQEWNRQHWLSELQRVGWLSRQDINDFMDAIDLLSTVIPSQHQLVINRAKRGSQWFGLSR